MEMEILLTIGSVLFSVGVSYGIVNTRLKNIERVQAEQRDIAERLARIEEKTNLIIKHFMK
jgi:type II secretory pathway component PulM